MNLDPKFILPFWEKTHRFPGGKWFFSRVVGYMAPYSRTIGVRFVSLRAGHCIATLKQRWSITNHLRCIHAMALANFGEFTSGISLLSALPSDARAIVTGFKIEYFKKARGTLKAECISPSISGNAEQTIFGVASITNAQGELVTRTTAEWKIGPRPR